MSRAPAIVVCLCVCVCAWVRGGRTSNHQRRALPLGGPQAGGMMGTVLGGQMAAEQMAAKAKDPSELTLKQRKHKAEKEK